MKYSLAGTESQNNAIPHEICGVAMGALTQGVVITGADRKILFINSAFTDITGYALDEVQGKTCAFLQGPQTDPVVVARIATANAEGSDFHGEIYNYHKGGVGYWNELSISAVKNAEGTVLYFVGINRDVTERKLSQSKLHESLQRYQDLMENVHIGVLIYGTRGEVLTANAYAKELLALSADEIRGRDSFHPAWDLIREDGTVFPQDELPVPRVIISKKNVSNVVIGVGRAHKGDRVWLQVSAHPILDADGELFQMVVTLVDVSALKASEQALRLSQAAMQSMALHSQAVVDNMLDAVVTINAKGIVQSFSKSAARMFGYEPAEVIGENVSTLMPMPHRQEHDSYLRHFEKTGEARIIGYPRELHGQRKDGTMMPIVLSVSKISRDGEPFFVGILRDITQRRHDEDEIRRLAFYDPLTQLPNRRLLVDRLRQALANSSRTGSLGAVIMLDLDHFKVINELLGHQAGDYLLQQVGTRLTDCLREGDSLARLGGDEFVVLIEGLSPIPHEAATETETVATKVLTVISRSFELNGQVYDITPSIGIAVFTQDHPSTDEMLKMADIALYQAKAAGRNTLRFFDPAMQAQAADRMALVRDIRNGLVGGEFVLHYQLQFNGDGVAIGAEALVRWVHPTRGMVSPAAFIPLSEETGLILPLGIWILETACQQLVNWAQDPLTAHLKLAVNVSALQLAQDNFVSEVSSALLRTGANPQRLKLELTESMLARDVEELIVKMTAIQALGVGFSLDDFGTGYSSLSYLKRLPLNQLKIDQSFVRDLETDPNDAAISRTVVALGHSLGLNVIAEGVETKEQRDYLLNFGCDAFQGYLFARPCPAEAIFQYLK